MLDYFGLNRIVYNAIKHAHPNKFYYGSVSTPNKMLWEVKGEIKIFLAQYPINLISEKNSYFTTWNWGTRNWKEWLRQPDKYFKESKLSKAEDLGSAESALFYLSTFPTTHINPSLEI